MLKNVLSCAALIALSTAQFCHAQSTAKIAYVGGPSRQELDLYTMDVDGSNRIRLTEESGLIFNNNEDYQIASSPDGKRLVARLRDGRNKEIFIIDNDGANPVNLTNDAGLDTSPAWSPDGTRIAFSSLRGALSDIYVMDVDGSNLIQLTHDTGDDRSPSWSPDGRQLAFASNRDGNFDIYVMNADGSNQTRLTDSSREEGNPDWSPDGSRIAYSSDRCLRAIECTFQSDIMVMDAGGGNVVNLTNNAEQNWGPVWSPDGSQVAFTSDRDANGERGLDIYVMDADGSNQINITNGNPGEIFRAPTWLSEPSTVVTLIDAISWGEVKARTAPKK